MTYQAIAQLNEIPEGKGKVVPIGQRQILLLNIEGDVYALDSFCAHHGAPLVQGQVVEGQLLCPWHGVHFDVETGSCPIAPEERVQTYPVEVREGQIWVALDTVEKDEMKDEA